MTTTITKYAVKQISDLKLKSMHSNLKGYYLGPTSNTPNFVSDHKNIKLFEYKNDAEITVFCCNTYYNTDCNTDVESGGICLKIVEVTLIFE
jgi:hypothetical protein